MYKAPVAEIAFTLRHVAGLDQAIEIGSVGDLSADLADAILEEAARFTDNEIVPLAAIGDTEGARLVDGVVVLPKGWPKLYRDWAAGGWNGLTASPEFGGQGLPQMLNVATLEMWNGASMAFGLAPTLTMGAIEALSAHGSPALKDRYLARMISGEWTGTMNLTEPHAGSDVGALTSRAERHEDGSYRIFGQKIYITWGDHDAADNIIHLVLARLPDAPPGTRGISLFLVPKFLVGADGSLGARNDLFCHSLEHKLGIHGSPTCTMIYGDGRLGETPGAIGWLVGEENRGLACMFTMMNNARLAVAMQGVGVCEAATQKAVAYARERRQGRAAGHHGGSMSPIVDHPDVARMLLTMKALTQGARAITYACAHAIDLSHAGMDTNHWRSRAALLTPIAKAFATDCGVDVASLGIQVHGGMGYIEETGAARLWRDARIAPIYEGTNGIQAIDLVTRKLPLDGGQAVRGLIGELQAICERVAASGLPLFGATADRLRMAIADIEAATEWLLSAQAGNRIEEALAGATPYLRLFGLVLSGCYLAKGGMAVADDGEGEARIALCRFAAKNLLPETAALKDQVMRGADSLIAARALLT
ncbi:MULTISPECIES: acyl-CoA dehydrogenase [Rhizobium]|uniref:Acyl-CoA dehydrogenase n=1 Tax=Rhizobium rhododendri TaxID=2506430 RepID=A0ABY8IJS7_9HYPH|nr:MULTISPECIES: acyl-CoA dehydrogenase [Rhizobium]MBZ5761036.1 acyl-CoA dehydrogenase [Rhizobium sp. VS19-DR96]MBZ5767276.1 acyl-CoA dehydrogenase [Rhizobium sp. VS19-DR129.2]MBZ5773435.1 acyl-CoA dehydrogenase [Rhizobium sp. VS19-DRK62.2]MBZ5785588.1 acyl-CoA dehydrogenase [Rhizobium sp. VS19-DR121]MBZ5802409.1 acyl-CoA dehydrogenase [Rhizobium sp. VS19-DR181]